mmetsp:Transcript_37374/g.98864  ORF Transcript_37374/g.98864 Transcript_37374/m.98864 type:complete len:300 (+) Transcript_37374:3-902(+)
MIFAANLLSFSLLLGPDLSPHVNQVSRAIAHRRPILHMVDRVSFDASKAIDIDVIVREELSALAKLTPEEQDERLPSMIERMEARTTAESNFSTALRAHKGEELGKGDGYQFGDVTKSVVEATRSEVQRQLDAEWNIDDVSLLLKIGIFLGATATAPVAGLAALPAAALLATYGTVLKAELGVRAVKEVGVRLTERAAQGIADGVRTYTGKEEYKFGDLTEATVHKVTGKDDYRFGDVTKSALDGAGKALTGQDDYKFGSITEKTVRAVTGDDDYKFGDFTKGLFKKMTAGDGEDKRKR